MQMLNKKITFYLGLVLFFHLNVYANDLNFDHLFKKFGLSKNDLSMQIMFNDKITFQQNDQQKKIPASVTKILTSFAILKQIPLNIKFKTELFYDQKNIYVKGGGDPGFVSESMWNLVNDFKRLNVQKIAGDIIIDDTLFDSIRYDESRESIRVDRSYDAPVSALSFNWNSVNIYVKPVNGKVQVVLDPESNYFTLKNKAVVSKSKITKDLIISVDQKNKVIQVSGEISAQQSEKAYFKNVADPVQWFGENLKSFLKQRNIEFTGKVKSGKIPQNLEPVVTVDSKTLSAMLSDMNKFSNNFVAEMLTKKMASIAFTAKSAQLVDGVNIIKSELKKINITNLILENPSGLTRDNQFSASQLNQVLENIKNDFKIFPTFMDSLPIAGLDGTLKKRMKDTSAQGYVRAKTGYLDGVVSLAGYAAKSDSSNLYTFSFIYNGAKDEAQVRKFFDDVLLDLLN